MENKQTHGTDLHLELMITPEAAAQGCQKEIVVLRYERCQACNRKSQDATTHCGQCRGEGRVQNNRRIVLNIPAGVKDGMNIRLTGAGNAGISSSPPGNIYVVLSVTAAKQTTMSPHASQIQPSKVLPSAEDVPISTSFKPSPPIQPAEIMPESRAVDARDTGPAVWKVGDIILDQYEVMGILGEGGMGIVYSIYHHPWDMVMAVKSPRPEIFAREGGKENFTQEAEIWVNLGTYPHLVHCYFVETLGGIPRVFAEYVAGGSLADWIRQRKLYEGGTGRALERILDITIQFAWGLHFAHEQGLVHQDIKPANVMMTQNGVAKVTDFGLVKARVMAGEGMVQDGKEGQSILVSSRGMTLAYCSPEQAARQAISRKTDIWSWGLSVLEMFTGEVTWITGVVAQEVLASYKQQGSAIPAMPVELQNLLKRCFQQTPEARPATMLEVATELQEIYAHSVRRRYWRSMPQPSVLQIDSLINQGSSLIQLGRLEEALTVSEQAIHLDPNSADAYYNLGGALQELGRLEEALVAYERVIHLKPSDGEAHNHRGTVLMRLGRLEEGLFAFEQAIQLDPNCAPVYYNRGNALAALGRLEESLAAYERALLYPSFVKFAPAHYRKGLALVQLKRPKEALVAFEQAIRLDPNHADAHFRKGLALSALERLQEALVAFEQAIRLDPNHADAHTILDALFKVLGRPKEALVTSEQSSRLHPNSAPMYYEKGLALVGQGQLKEALVAFEQAIRLNPNDVPAHFNRGNALRELGRLKEALAAYEQAIRLDPTFVLAYNNKGAVLQQLGRQKEAEQAYRKGQELRP